MCQQIELDHWLFQQVAVQRWEFHISGRMNAHIIIWGIVTYELDRENPKANIWCRVARDKVYGPFSSLRRLCWGPYLDLLQQLPHATSATGHEHGHFSARWSTTTLVKRNPLSEHVQQWLVQWHGGYCLTFKFTSPNTTHFFMCRSVKNIVYARGINHLKIDCRSFHTDHSRDVTRYTERTSLLFWTLPCPQEVLWGQWT